MFRSATDFSDSEEPHSPYLVPLRDSEPEDWVKNRTLFFGDNLKILREKFPSDEGYFDLIYLDPPFNSQATYNVLFKEGVADSEAQVAAFEDSWHWTADTHAQFTELASNPSYSQKVADAMQGMEKVLGHNDLMAYLTMMAVRLVELRRVIKETGSLYLHCDPTASHYLKLLLDAIFGPQNFRNEIIWKRTLAHSSAKRYGPLHDVILFYSASETFTWNDIKSEVDRAYIESHFKKTDTEGSFQDISLTGAGTRNGESGSAWRTFNPTLKGRHWAISGGITKKLGIPDTLTVQEKLEALDAAGRIYWPKSKGESLPRLKWYVEDAGGAKIGDIWSDIPPINSQAKERLGYPTQKPEALLERIIQASTNEGDWVLDPFGGCGTTAAAAEKLGRQWVIIDVTTLAINLVKRRVEAMYPDKQLQMTVEGYPADLAGAKELFLRDPFEFEYWCCDLVNARPAGDKSKGKMKGADRGIDGIITFIDVQGSKQEYRRLLVQVKGGHLTASQMRDFVGTIQREKAAGGVFVTLDHPTKAMQKDAIEAGSFTYALTGQPYPVVQLLTVEELLAGKRPDVPNLVGYAKAAPPKDSAQQNGLF